MFVAVVLISKSVCRCGSYIEKEKTSGNEITYIAAHLKQQKQPLGVLLNSTQDPLKIFEKFIFKRNSMLKVSSQIIPTQICFQNLPRYSVLALEVLEFRKNLYFPGYFLWLNQFNEELAILRNYTDIIVTIVTSRRGLEKE